MSSTPLLHSFGPQCRLKPVSISPSINADDAIPAVAAQFFYSSTIPIDDPLSPGTSAGTSDFRSGRGPLRPFSLGDNNALEKAWINLLSEEDSKVHEQLWRDRRLSPIVEKATASKLSLLVRNLAAKHAHKHGTRFEGSAPVGTSAGTLPEAPITPCCPDLLVDTSTELQNTFCALARRRHPALSQDNVMQGVAMELRRWITEEFRPDVTWEHSGGKFSSRALAESSHSRQMSNTGSFSPRRESVGEPSRFQKDEGRLGVQYRARSDSRASNQTSRSSTPDRATIVRLPTIDDGISGKPFLRAAARQPQPTITLGIPSAGSSTFVVSQQHAVDVVVGISRLHMVSMPALQMKPIYWSPVNDIAVVLRATWFYRDTMLPVPSTVANQLEAGYRELRPHTETWGDEIRCAVDVGPLGEEKVSHRLWPEESNRASGEAKRLIWDTRISADPYCAASCFHGEAAAQGSVDPNPSFEPATPQHRSYATYNVIYKDAVEAFLLKPSLKPSAYYGRRPVAKIMKGMTVGIPVVRGFDRKKWDRVHDKKLGRNSAQQPPPAVPNDAEIADSHSCTACKAEKERGQVTDLVLVVHGIGQKFAERVESFHFTHAINAFRREVNLELSNPAVKAVLRADQNGIMVLPINWRHTLSFEDGGPMTEEDKAANVPDGFALKDIEPGSIPAVRSMISDIMFDIPFYMSHHKSKMIEALVTEANRVYRLWCRNNPGFAEKGRVHLIGHSLGSAMAIDILSRQPSHVPMPDFRDGLLQSDFFEFDTKNLFLVGSPAGFFMLLERGMLQPRRGRKKPGANSSDIHAHDLTGQAGRFGCIAVDNIYNILAKEDPIAYLLNGTIDPVYAASLKTAYVPSTSSSLFKYVGNAVRSLVPGSSNSSVQMTASVEPRQKPSVTRLPSQLELEVHDFTREDNAEKKAYMLNDNGQVDYYLRYGGGPLEIQYLNMLSAHTCYWTSLDFIRMVCMEIGREPGRQNTIPILRAQKATKRVNVGG
ncbi:putative phospholipase [Colletotrichum sidae]|nr:putative phospholipase [Colletotrichum sidae]